jgi:hypothetical protein
MTINRYKLTGGYDGAADMRQCDTGMWVEYSEHASLLKAMTLQHEAALDAVVKARESAVREAAEVQVHGTVGMAQLTDRVKDAILALINKGDSRE